MEVTYIKLFVDYLDAIEPLGDAERGRLFTALLEYARSGEVPHLGGNERFLFPMMKAQMDRDMAAIDDLSIARSEAGKLGGRPTKKQKKQTEAKKANAFCESKKSKEEDKEEDKDKDKYIHSFSLSAREEEKTCSLASLNVSDRDRFALKRIYGTLGDGLVVMSDEQFADLCDKLSLDEINKYMSIVRDCEREGKHFKNKSHYQAILDMVAKDRKVGR